MNSNKHKQGILFYTAIYLAVVFFVCAIASPILLSTNVIKVNLDSLGTTGDALGGLTNPFLAATGIIVTFLAFYIQYQANQQQLEQINQSKIEQNDLLKQQMFFKLMDNQQQRIFNLSKMNYGIRGASPDITGTAALDSILFDGLYNKEDLEFIGKEILTFKSDILTDHGLFQILHQRINIGHSQVNDLNPIINILMKIHDYDFKVQAINSAINPIVRKDTIKRIFDDLGYYYFNFASEKNKQKIYSKRYKSIASKNQTFIDGYVKGFEHIINLLKDKGLSKDYTFIDYLKYNLTIGEKKILFLYFASGNGKPETKVFVFENELLLDLCNDKFLSNHEDYKSLMEEEIRSILSK